MNFDIPPDFGKQVAGTAGALSSLLWTKGSWPRRAGMVASGIALSYYAMPTAASYTGVPEGLCGFLLGLFWLPFVNKLFTTWDGLDFGGIARDFIRKIAGLPPKES